MKSLERRFKTIAKRNPLWSSYICFFKATRGEGFSRNIIHKWFNRLVEKDDYDRRDKRAILSHIESYSKPSEENRNQE